MNELQEIVFKIQKELTPFIWDYVGNYIPKDKMPKDKSGKTRCHCFNHRGNGIDKDKDMQFYPETGTFHCFSCGEDYNIFKLANLYEGKPLEGKEFFTNNVLYLADRYGVNTHGLEKYEIGTQQIKHTSFFNIMAEISSYITRNCNEKFIASRKISKETAVVFGVGSIKDMGDFSNFLSKFKKENLMALSILNEKGEINTNVFDITKLIITLKDVNGNPNGFSSREMIYNISVSKNILKRKYNFDDKVLDNIKTNNDLKGLIDHGRMEEKDIEFFKKVCITNKYNYTKTSEIFRKREMVFGYIENKSMFLTNETVRVLESPIDIIVAHTAGIRNVIAVGGDSLSEEQFDFIENSREIAKVSLMLDNDKAGKDGTIKIIEKIVGKIKTGDTLNKKYYITKYNKGALKDLDENLNIFKSLDEFTTEISLFEFYLENELSTKGKEPLQVVDDFVKIMTQEENPLQRVKMVRQLYQTLEKKAKEEDVDLEITESIITQQLNFYVNKTDEQIRKIAKKEIRNFEKKIPTMTAKDISYHVEKFRKEVAAETSSIGKKKKTIFNVFGETLETDEENKYTEEPKNFNCGFDMFEGISWTGDEMIVLLAKPHTGKTLFMSNITMNYLKYNKKTAVLYITTDDNTRKIVNNFIAIHTGLDKAFVNEPKNNIKFGLVSNAKDKMDLQKRYQQGYRYISDLSKSKRLVTLQTTEGYNEFENIVSAVEEFQNDKDLRDFEKLVILDSANKVRIKGVDEDETKKIQFLSKSIKQDLAQRFGLRVIANFELTKLDTRTRVNKSKIKGSAAVEYDADMIISLSQPMIELSKITNTNWSKPGVYERQAVLVPIIEKCKPTGGQYFKPFFYKMDGSNARIFQTEDEKEYNTLFSSWLNDVSKDNKDGYRND